MSYLSKRDNFLTTICKVLFINVIITDTKILNYFDSDFFDKDVIPIIIPRQSPISKSDTK